MKLVLVAAVAVALLVFYDRHQRHQAATRLAAERQLVLEQKAAEARADRQRKAEQVKQQVAVQRAAMSPQELRAEAVQRQFHPWDGSHMAVEAGIKARMNDPESYKHVQTRFRDEGPGRGLTVYTTFRGSNAFGAVVTNQAVAAVSEAGAVISLNLSQTLP
ncbi:MAG: hypothetical protein LW854_15050 [Rubrivivax sp.]|nr:hypothetical protein [Rubrivivax sp.]